MSFVYRSNGVAGPFPALPTIVSYRAVNKGVLVAYADIMLPGEITIRNIAVCAKDGARWINNPTQEVPRRNGRIEYRSVIEFSKRDAQLQFQAEVLAAVDRFTGEMARPQL